MRFTPAGRRAVHAAFDAGAVTSDAGLLLLREQALALRLFERMAACIPDPRDPDKIEHEQPALLAQRVLAIACGWEDLADHLTLRTDPALMLAAGREIEPDATLASPASLCRFENRVGRKACVDLSKLLVELFIESFDAPPDEITLDFDATDDPVHGRQEGRHFHGYYDAYCYQPLYVFCGHKLLVACLRPGNVDAARHSRAILRLLVARLRAAWPNVRIVFRADSGFCRFKLLRWCERHGVDYVVGLARNAVLERTVEPHMQAAKACFEQTGEAVRHFHELRYAAGTWDRERRVIHKAEHNARGDNPRFVVTSLADEPRVLYEQRYCARGEMENRIKEQQMGLFADRTSCHAFTANQFRLLLSSFAYVLMQTLRERALAGTELASAQVWTIRARLLKLGAVVTTSVRRIVLRLSTGYPLRELFAEVARRLVLRVHLE